MSYPWIMDSDFPLVDYTVDKDGNHIVVFRDESQAKEGKITYATVRADVVLAIAYKMCVDHMDTEWAKRHLESKGYVVTKKQRRSYLGSLLGLE